MLFILLSSPIHAKASSLALSQEAVSLMGDAVEYLSYVGSIPFEYLSLFAFSADSNKSYQSIVENYLGKADVFDFNGVTVSARPLTQAELASIENINFYDENGTLINLADLYYAECENGYFTEHLYVKNDGSMLYLDANKDTPALNVKYGGSEFSVTQWENTYDSIYNSLASTQFNYSLDSNINLANSDISVYYAVGCKYSDRLEFNVIYVPNIYSADMKISDGTYPQKIYCKNGASPLIYVSDNRILANRFWNVEYNNVRYDIRCDYSGYFRNASRCSYADFVSMSANGRDYLIDYSGWTYDSNLASLYDDNNIKSFRKVGTQDDTIDISKSYDISTLEDVVDDVSTTIPEVNPAYDPSIPIGPANYPIIYDIPISIAVDDPIPFPDDEDVTDEPIVEPLPDVIDPSLITNNIPIISGLENKFPFSIPWDIYKLVKGLSVTRETPSINQTVTIPIINYDWEIDLDLSMYDDSAELFRSLFLILFIIGLAVFSYQHFFGS